MKHVTFIIASLAAAAAFANDASEELLNRQPTFRSTMTRAEVQAEYLDARRSGTLPLVGEAASQASPTVAGQADRNRVRDEARMASRRLRMDLLP